MLKRWVSMAVGMGLLSVTGGPADAASVQSQFFLGERNQASDNSAEYHIKGEGNTGGDILEVGDRLRGIFDVNTIEDLDGGGGVNALGLDSPNNQWSGVFDVVVTGKFEPNTQPFGAQNACVTAQCDFTFGAYAPFADEIGGPPGTAIALFEGPSPGDYTRLGAAGTEEALIANILADTLRWVVGFSGDDDDYWLCTNCVQDVAVASVTPPPGSAGTVNIQVSTLLNLFPGISFGNVATTFVFDDGLVDGFNGSTNILGTQGIATPFQIFDNLDFVFLPQQVQVPGPAPLILMGFGLIGLAFAARRNRR